MADLPRGQRRLTPRVRGMRGAVPTQLTPTAPAPTWSAFSPGMPRDGRTTPSKTAPPSRTNCTPFRSVQRTRRCRTETRALLQSLFGTDLLNWTNLPHKTETQNGHSKYLWSSPLRAGQAEEEPWTPGSARPLLRRRQAEKGKGEDEFSVAENKTETAFCVIAPCFIYNFSCWMGDL